MAVSGVIFLLLGFILPNAFFRMQTDIGEIIDAGTTYTSIVMIGSFGLFMQMFFERLLQSTGKTMMSMTSQVTGAMINIIMDPILIFGYFGFPAMGVAGAAIATSISQLCSFVFAIFYRYRRRHQCGFDFKLSRETES